MGGREMRMLVRAESGVTSIEYALLASLIAVGIVLGVTALSGSVMRLFNAVVAAF